MTWSYVIHILESYIYIYNVIIRRYLQKKNENKCKGIFKKEKKEMREKEDKEGKKNGKRKEKKVEKSS